MIPDSMIDAAARAGYEAMFVGSLDDTPEYARSIERELWLNVAAAALGAANVGELIAERDALRAALAEWRRDHAMLYTDDEDAAESHPV